MPTLSRCPRCSSEHRASPGRVLGLPFHYTCRDAWHMPSRAQEAEDFMDDTDAVFAKPSDLPAKYEAESMGRESTAGYR